jgi:MinD superfamily P-loop ATPase
MIISFASGKGGTGKTTVATNFALLLAGEENHKIQFLDCDVEEPNAGIFLKPDITVTTSVGIPVPAIDFDKCTYCGECSEICAYNAIAVLKNDVLVFRELCHGCGGCTLFCPEQAISETNREIGIIESGKADTIKFIQGKINVGEPMAAPLIRKVKETGLLNNQYLTIIDVAPGTSCPVIEAVKNSDFSVLVTEPTPFGMNDLILAVKTLQKLNIPFGVVVNRDGIGDKGVEDYCKKKNIPVLVRIPMDKEIAIAYSKGEPIIYTTNDYKTKFEALFKKITEQIGEKNILSKLNT